MQTTLDITSCITRALRDRSRWSADAAGRLTQSISELVSGEVDWDRGAGEDWARVLVAENVVCTIAIPVPLGLVLSRQGPAISGILRDHGVVVIEFDEWDEPRF